MIENKLILPKCLKLVFAIILIFDKINNAFGKDEHIGGCESLTSSISTNVKCEYKGNPLENCEDPKDGTTVLISCNPFYEESSVEKNPLRVCMDGKWNPSIPQCYPICGRASSKVVNRSILPHGNNNSLHDYPWHVGIYKSENHELLCGGSIISPKMILTAAHCVSTFDGNIQPSKNYVIAAGKYYRNYVDERDEIAQYSEISEIHLPMKYNGLVSYFAYDIAVLILSKPFMLSLAVQPVCLESNEKFDNFHVVLNNDSIGIVTGWGYIKPGGPLSEVLKELIIPYVPFEKCLEEVPTEFRRYLTSDKICGGYLNKGISICGGDTGGGFIFRNEVNDRYYIKGIASTAPATEELQCDVNQYATYTSVSYHIDFVQSLKAL